MNDIVKIAAVGIIAADSLYGEITADMANAIAQSDAVKVLIPFQNCGVVIAGCGGMALTDLIAAATVEIAALAAEKR